MFDANRDPASVPKAKQTPAQMMEAARGFVNAHPPLKVVSGGN